MGLRAENRLNDDGLEFDLKSIRVAVQSAKNQRPRKGSFKMLGEEIDQDEEGIRFDDVTKAVFSSGPKLKPESDQKADKSSEGEQEEEESTKSCDTYAEYEAFPRELRIYDYPQLNMYNGHRLRVLKALNHAEAREKVCYIEELDNEALDYIYAAIQHDMEAINEVVRNAEERNFPSGPTVLLAEMIDRDDSDGMDEGT